MKSILITGGARGIGLACAKLFATKGWQVFSFDVSSPEERIDSVKHYLVDITKPAQIRRALKRIPQKLDVLLNNAGIIRRGTLYETTEKEWDAQMNVNLKGSWLMIKHSKPYLKRTATVMQISSKHGLQPQPDPAVYCLTKVAVIALADILEETMPSYTVKLICPGPVDTRLHRHGRTTQHLQQEREQGTLSTPDDMAWRIFQLLHSSKAKLLYDVKRKKYVMR
ncbi:SDR family NAD(P)-dependent oxidoreductase [Candidatus Woesearchaeota archaeon]|nr:SDR family NAD(P)-dependent oxidoreductase [Candidatus Woesearchaeota archaeon]